MGPWQHSARKFVSPTIWGNLDLVHSKTNNRKHQRMNSKAFNYTEFIFVQHNPVKLETVYLRFFFFPQVNKIQCNNFQPTGMDCED